MIFRQFRDNANDMKNTPQISVIILTFHRIEGALSAVRSILAQTQAPSYEIILMDNDANSSARPAADILATEAKGHGIDFTYAVEPKAGVANARNSAVKLARGQFIAFLDDDEVAFKDWLQNLYNAQKTTNAEVVFGPIEARLGKEAAEPKHYFQEFFSRTLDGETRIVEKAYGCGNCLIMREKVLKGETPFNPMTNETGGEDDLLWVEVRRHGGKFAWAHDAMGL